jgi:hypothetical protein
VRRFLTTTLLLFYAALSVALIAERTGAWATAFTQQTSKSSVPEVGATKDHSGQTRIVEDSFVVSLDATTVALAEAEPNSLEAVRIAFTHDPNPKAPSRASPTIL